FYGSMFFWLSSPENRQRPQWGITTVNMENTTSRPLRIGIIGYGNLGKGVVRALRQNPDMELVAIFTRRAPAELGLENAVSLDDIEAFKQNIDVMVLCGGSSK